MRFFEAFEKKPYFMMEGALGERLKREYGLEFDRQIAMARLVCEEPGRNALASLWREYRAIANEYCVPFLATTPTRRANRERMKAAGEDGRLLRENVRFLRGIQSMDEGEMYVGGLMGCRGDAYTGLDALGAEEAYDFHSWQAEAFRVAGVDFLFAGIMPTVQEAVGMARAMADTELPYIISFTIRRDGRLIDGTTIDEAIARVDECAGYPPVCLMTNCVHPSVVRDALMQHVNRTERVKKRFLGIQANTSPMEYSLLDGARELFCSEPDELAEETERLCAVQKMKIIGGCCGTDGRHMRSMMERSCGGKEMKNEN